MRFTATLLCCMLGANAWSQAAKDPVILKAEQINAILPLASRPALGISFPIYRVYQYSDKSGTYYLTLTESRDKIDSEQKDTSNHKLKAINLKVSGDSLISTWTIND